MYPQRLQEHTRRIPSQDSDTSRILVLSHRISLVVVCARLAKSPLIEEMKDLRTMEMIEYQTMTYLQVEQPVFDRGPLFLSP